MRSGQRRFDQSDFKGAVADWEKGLGLARGLGDLGSTGNLCFKLGIAYHALGEYPQAVEYLGESINMARTLGDRKAEGARIRQLGVLYDAQGSYQKAIGLYEQALAIAMKAGDLAGEGAALGDLGASHSKLGDYDQALSYHGQSLAVVRKLGDKVSEAAELCNIGVVHQFRGDDAKSLEYFAAAREIDRKTGDKAGEWADLNNIGIVFRNLHDYPKALEHYFQALAITRKLGDRLGESVALGNIGIVYQNLGDFPKALSFDAKSLEIRSALGDRSGESTTISNMGLVYESLGDSAKALESFTRALQIKREIGARRGEVETLDNIGMTHRNLGNFSRGIDFYIQAQKIMKDLAVASVEIESHHGEALLARGDLAAAREVFTRVDDEVGLGSCDLLAGEFAPARDHFSAALSSATATHEATKLIAGQLGLGLALEGLADAAGARRAFEKAVQAIERQRELLSPGDRGNFLTGREFGFPRIEAYKGRARSAADPSDGFYWSEKTKARVFIEALSTRLRQGSAELPRALAKTEAKLDTRIASIYNQMEIAFQRKNESRYKSLETDLAKAKKEQADFISKLRKEQPEYAAVQYPQPIQVESVALKSGEFLIEYEVTDSKTLLFLVSQGKVLASSAIPITRKELQGLVKDFRAPFENPMDDNGLFAGNFAAEAGAKLYELLLKPVLALIPPGARIIVVPDEVLGVLPFEALIAEAPKEIKQVENAILGGPMKLPAPAGLRYVGDDYDIAYAQSAAALTLARTLRKGQSAAQGIFILADPVFDKSDPRAPASASVDKRLTADFPRLEQTRALADSLQKNFGTDSVALIGIKADERKLKQEDLSSFRYLALATHGILDADVPYIREPALVLNQVGNAEEDGFLTMSEVMGLKLNADVVALTACKTGLGKEVGGEGVMGLGRAFQYAGAKTVLVSLWSVAEQSTTMMAEKFFLHMKEGRTARQALKQARSEVRAAGYEHPFFWAPFILVGE